MSSYTGLWGWGGAMGATMGRPNSSYSPVVATGTSSISSASRHAAVARAPLSGQIATFSSPAGIVYQSGFAPAVAARMKYDHAGTATVPANPRFMIGAGVSNPNHTPVIKCGV